MAGNPQRTCEKCDKPHHGRGLCRLHYERTYPAASRRRATPGCRTWNPERVAILESLYAEGHGPSEIARRMDLTKNQVSGRMDRKGMVGPGKPMSTFAARMDALDALLPEHSCAHEGCKAAAVSGRRHCVEHQWLPPWLDEAAE